MPSIRDKKERIGMEKEMVRALDKSDKMKCKRTNWNSLMINVVFRVIYKWYMGIKSETEMEMIGIIEFGKWFGIRGKKLGK